MFKRRGASQQSIQMLYSFLEKRQMRVRIEGEMSDPLPINGGSPQGTLLGNLIFIVATSELDKNIIYQSDILNVDLNETLDISEETTVTINEENIDQPSESETDSLYHFRRSCRNTLLDSSEDSEDLNSSVTQHKQIRTELTPEGWSSGTPLIVQYVDDILGCEKLFATTGKTHTSTKKKLSTIFARNSEHLIPGDPSKWIHFIFFFSKLLELL